MAAPVKTRNPWLVLVFLSLGFFMILLDTTIVNIAIPSIIPALKSSLDQILWVLNAYLLVYAVLLITAGRLGDLWSPRNLFITGLIVFTVASAICGLSQNGTQLILARILQGIGGALLTPQTLTIITSIFPADSRGAAFGIWGAVAGVAAVTGPTLGGFLVSDVNWRWIFYVNVPVGIVALLGALFVVPDIRPGRRHRFDVIGVLLASAGLFGIVFGLVEGQRYNWGAFWGPVTIPEVIAAGAVLFAVFVLFERFQAEPLMPLSLFSNRNYSIMLWVSLAVSFGMLGFFLPLTIFLQSVLGFSALKAGLTFLPMSLISAFVAPIAGRMADRFGGKYILIAGLTLFATGMGLVVYVIALSATQATFWGPAALAGVGLGMTFAPLTTVAMRQIRPQMAGAASGVLNTVRQLGGALGSAVIGAVLQNRLAVQLHEQAVSYSNQIPAGFRQRFIDAFSNASSSGFEVGRGQTGGAQLPPGVPAQVVARLTQVFHDVFVNAYTNAVRPTLAVSIAVLGVGAFSCLFIERRVRAQARAERQEAAGRTPGGVTSYPATSASAWPASPPRLQTIEAAQPDGNGRMAQWKPEQRRRSVMLVRYVVGVVWSVLAWLAGGWLILSPWALGSQGAATWSSATWNFVASGTALVVVAALALMVTVRSLIADLRDIGMVRARVSRPKARPAPAAAAIAEDPQASLTLLARALADELERLERRAPAEPRPDAPSWEARG